MLFSKVCGMSRWRRLAPVVGLFFLAPFVGEFVLGNISIAGLFYGIALAPMYGGGAVLIRELGRRYGSGWPTIALLACAYALIEEGPLDQLLWNESYPGVGGIHTATYVPALGTSVALIQTVLALHAVWSICVPIALVETLVEPRRRETPWLSPTGLVVLGAIYLLGAAFVFWGNYHESHFLGPALPQVLIGAAIATLIMAAFAIRSRRLPAVGSDAPAPWLAGLAALGATSAYWAVAGLGGGRWQEWAGVAIWCLVVGAGIPVLSRWSRQRGWDAQHRFAVAAGATLTYVWMAFPTVPVDGASPSVDLISNLIFGAGTILLLLAAHRTLMRERLRPHDVRPATHDC
ncbi:hypothetical protein MOBUDSM44075_03833 [Mycolicibacterium obuense]|uniref:DUF998 domain-containing protein n=1 Tax=Mycolicibacterium obuense TaxID=1807 RepID=A0A0J6YL79_9MYCO|nr:hypothetical protein MOBUDSM44075_03833 [Mycolicibacterium obuense]